MIKWIALLLGYARLKKLDWARVDKTARVFKRGIIKAGLLEKWDATSAIIYIDGQMIPSLIVDRHISLTPAIRVYNSAGRELATYPLFTSSFVKIKEVAGILNLC